MTSSLIVGAIILLCALAIPVSVKYFGPNNAIEQDAKQIIEEEIPELSADIENFLALS